MDTRTAPRVQSSLDPGAAPAVPRPALQRPGTDAVPGRRDAASSSPRRSATRSTNSALEIVPQLSQPELLAELKRAIPDRYDVPGMDPLPNCVQVDFAITPAPDGELEGKVVELQAFPSRYAMMVVFADVLERGAGRGPRARGRLELLQRLLGARHRQLLGAPSSAASAPEDGGAGRLRARASEDGPRLRRHREALRRRRGLPDRAGEGRAPAASPRRRRASSSRSGASTTGWSSTSWRKKATGCRSSGRDELDVTWCSTPTGTGPGASTRFPSPRSSRRCRARALPLRARAPPRRLERYVLKPLFSFAGAGVVIDVTPEDMARIPAEQRDGWLLQEKITYAPAIQCPRRDRGEGRGAGDDGPPARRASAPARSSTWSACRAGRCWASIRTGGLDWVGATVGLWRPLHSPS